MFVSGHLFRETKKRETENEAVLEFILALYVAHILCAVSFRRQLHGLCSFSAVTADVEFNASAGKYATCSSVHENFKSRKWRSLVNIPGVPQGVLCAIKLLVYFCTVYEQVFERVHKLRL